MDPRETTPNSPHRSDNEGGCCPAASRRRRWSRIWCWRRVRAGAPPAAMRRGSIGRETVTFTGTAAAWGTKVLLD